MKKLITTIVCLVAAATFVMAQTCDQFITSTNGKKFVYSNLDSKGNNAGSLNYAGTKKDASTLSVHSEITGKNGKSLGASDYDMNCAGNAIKIDMKSFIPAASAKQFSNMQMQGDGKFLTYPMTMKAGDKLEDGSADIIVNNNGSKFAEIEINLTNRTVESIETVKTGAGDFECYKISYDFSFKSKIMGIGIPFNMKAIEWYSPKLGRFVKSESYRKDKLMGSMILEAIN